MSFCEGVKLWTCTKTGTDATLTGNCVGGSQGNPTGCFATNCPPGAAACCRPTKPVCRMNFTTPAITADAYQFAAGLPYCGGPTVCATDGNFTVLFYPNYGATTCDPTAINYISLSIRRPMTAPGQVITLPNTGVSLYQAGFDPSKTCTTWTGSVTWNSEVPSWSVTLNATCSEAGKTGIRLVGTFTGDV